MADQDGSSDTDEFIQSVRRDMSSYAASGVQVSDEDSISEGDDYGSELDDMDFGGSDPDIEEGTGGRPQHKVTGGSSLLGSGAGASSLTPTSTPALAAYAAGNNILALT